MSFAATALRISSGVIVWALHFAAIYGLSALACARGAPSLVPWIVAVATALAFAAAVAVITPALRAKREFANAMTAMVAGMALVAILWEALPVLMVPACA